MFYTIYKITNLLNNKIYIGKHQTKDLDDGYMGSGKSLKRAIKKSNMSVSDFVEKIYPKNRASFYNMKNRIMRD